MLWYFFRAHRHLPRTLVGSWGAVIGEGVLAGLIGAAVVALWVNRQQLLMRVPGVIGRIMDPVRANRPVTWEHRRRRRRARARPTSS